MVFAAFRIAKAVAAGACCSAAIERAAQLIFATIGCTNAVATNARTATIARTTELIFAALRIADAVAAVAR